jgi:hypothetical protein
MGKLAQPRWAKLKLKFDKDQGYQLQAIESLVGLFDGQRLGQGEFVATQDTALWGARYRPSWGLVINWFLGQDVLLENLVPS